MRDDYDDYRPTAAQRKRRREKRIMRRKILFTQWVLVALFAAMGTFICFYSLRYKRELYENSFNGRESKRLAQITVERNCGRLEWSCLDWNKPSIDFYLSLDAVPMDEWTVYRLTGDTLKKMSE